MLKELQFYKQNFLYDNGIINFLLILREIYGDEKWFDYEMDGASYVFVLKTDEYDMQMRLTHTSLVVERWSEEKIKELMINTFWQIAKWFVKFTDNDRWYRDIAKWWLVLWKKINVEWANSSNDVMNAYIYKKLEEIPFWNAFLTEQDIQNEIDKLSIVGLTIKKEKPSDTNYLINEIYWIYVNSNIEQHIKKYSQYAIDKEKMELTSTTHPFENWWFGDKLKQSQEIDFYDNCLYQLWSKNKRFYTFFLKQSWWKTETIMFYYYFFSNSLIDLFDIKSILWISDMKNERIDKDTWSVSTLPQNIDFKSLWTNDFYTGSESDNQLKMLYYVYHRFRVLQNNDDEFNSFLQKNPSIYSYTQEWTFKTSFNYYQKIDRLFRFFEKLEQKIVEIWKDKKNYSLLHILFWPYWILQTIYNVKQDGKTPLLLNKATQYILSFISLRSLYMDAQNHFIKQKDEKIETLPEWLQEFENLYLEEIGQKKLQPLHELCYIVWHGIGTYLAWWDDKSYIFKLRNVKTRAWLVWWIQEFYHLMLKNTNKQDEKKPERIGSKTKDSLSKLLEQIEKTNREVIRDYIGIYMIQQYQLVKKGIEYWKKKNQDS